MRLLQTIFKNLQPQKLTTDFFWSSKLNAMDDISTLEYTTQQLNLNFKKDAFKSVEHLDAFYAIDEKTHIVAKRISTQYINIDNISIEVRERMSNSAFLYHRQIFLVYLTLVENFAASQPSALLTLLARAVNSATEMIKWRFYNYQSAPANVWLQISQLYKITEIHGLLDSKVHPYQNTEAVDQANLTLSSAYVKVWMLGSLGSLSFKCQQIELVCTMLEKLMPKIQIHREYDAKNDLFYADTTLDSPAKRIRNHVPVETYRYWGIDRFNTNLELCLSFIEFNIPPKQQSMQEIVYNKHALATMMVLRTEWSRDKYQRQRRTEDRIKTVKTATTAYGFGSTCNKIAQYDQLQMQNGLKHYQGSKSFDERLSSHHVIKAFSEPTIFYVDLDNSHSNIVDESSQGIGLRITKQANEVNLGMMISVFVKDEKSTARIGVIRTIKAVTGNELHIGVKVLSSQAACVEMSNASLKAKDIGNSSSNHLNYFKADNANNSHSFTCLYLPTEVNRANKESLIIPKPEYNNRDLFRVNILGKDMIIKLTDITEQQEDWLRVGFSEDI